MLYISIFERRRVKTRRSRRRFTSAAGPRGARCYIPTRGLVVQHPRGSIIVRVPRVCVLYSVEADDERSHERKVGSRDSGGS